MKIPPPSPNTSISPLISLLSLFHAYLHNTMHYKHCIHLYSNLIFIRKPLHNSAVFSCSIFSFSPSVLDFLLCIFIHILYRVTHKGWDCKDDIKLLKYDKYKGKSSHLPWIMSFNGLFIDMATKKLVAENYIFKSHH